jgi:hypothetical protein
MSAGASAEDTINAGSVTFIDRQYGPIAFAEAQWETRSVDSVTDAFVLTSKTHRDNATHLFVELRPMYLDAQGNPTGGTDLFGGATDVQQTFDERALSAVSAQAPIPVTSCTLDADGNSTVCSDGGSLDVSAAWSGQGPVSRPNYEDHFHVPASFVLIDRASGRLRSATAVATIGGQSFDASALQFADLGVNTQLVALVCPHGC